MISPALTSWPPKRFTPSRWEFESRPFLVDAAPFLCAMGSVLRGSSWRRPAGSAGGDVGDLDLGVLLAVPRALPVAGLVLVLEDRDLRALGGPDHLGGHRGRRERTGLRGDAVPVDQEDHRERHGLAHTGRHLVDLDDVTDGDPLLRPATAHDRVHRDSLSSSLRPGPPGTAHPTHGGGAHDAHDRGHAARAKGQVYGVPPAGSKS